MFHEEKKSNGEIQFQLILQTQPIMTHYIDMPLSDDISDLEYTKNIKLLKGKVKVWNRHWRHHFSYPTVSGSVTEKVVQYKLMLSRWLCTPSWSKDVFFSLQKINTQFQGKDQLCILQNEQDYISPISPNILFPALNLPAFPLKIQLPPQSNHYFLYYRLWYTS